MIQKDLHQVAVVEKDSFPELFPPTAFSKELKRQNSIFLVAELDESKKEASCLFGENIALIQAGKPQVGKGLVRGTCFGHARQPCPCKH